MSPSYRRHKITGGNRATAMVWQAVKAGKLPRLDGSIPCKDCGAPAVHYDHRDYNKPLEVEPVCASCNHARGEAKHWDGTYVRKKKVKPPKEVITFTSDQFRYWGQRGGNKRKRKLSPERRVEIARNAGLAAAEARKKKCTPQTT